MMTIIVVFFTGFVMSASQKQRSSISTQRSMRYTSKPSNDAKTWQNNVRDELFQLLKMDDLITYKNFISLNPKELSQAGGSTYHVKEVEINSTLSRRIRIIVTIPRAIRGLVPAVVMGAIFAAPMILKPSLEMVQEQNQIVSIRNLARFWLQWDT